MGRGEIGGSSLWLFINQGALCREAPALVSSSACELIPGPCMRVSDP